MMRVGPGAPPSNGSGGDANGQRVASVRLERAIGSGNNILELATELLRLCRDQLEELIRADNDPGTWRVRDRLRVRAEEFFADVDDEDIDRLERVALATLAREAEAELAPVIVARVIAEALDAVLGSRLLPMHVNRSIKLSDGDAIPTPHPDWRSLTPSPNSDPWALDGRLDALPHLRLAADWAKQVSVTLDGDWRTWHAIPQLGPGDKLACAVPNESFDEFRFERDTVEGRAVFFDLQPAIDSDEQSARCLDLLERASRHDCRVVVFPELSVPKPVLETIAKWLNRQDQIEMIIAGSRHRKARGGRWHNESQILFRGWRQRRRHRKFRPFSFIDTEGTTRVSRHEHLAVTMPKLRVWLSPHWTLAVLICKDVVQEPIPRLLGDLRANLVAVPGLSFKMDAFRTAAADIATWAQGIALIANAAVRPRKRAPRPPVVIGLPSQSGSVHSSVPSGRGLVLVTLGNDTRKALVTQVSADD